MNNVDLKALSFENLVNYKNSLSENINDPHYIEVFNLIEIRASSLEAEIYYKDIDPARIYRVGTHRFVAILIDGTLIGYSINFFESLVSESNSDSYNLFMIFMSSLIYSIYSICCHSLGGQTLGKALLSIKVVDLVTEGRLSWNSALKRDAIPAVLSLIAFFLYASNYLFEPSIVIAYAVFALSSFYLIWYLLELCTMVFNEKGRAVHDKIASSVVIKI